MGGYLNLSSQSINPGTLFMKQAHPTRSQNLEWQSQLSGKSYGPFSSRAKVVSNNNEDDAVNDVTEENSELHIEDEKAVSTVTISQSKLEQLQNKHASTKKISYREKVIKNYQEALDKKLESVMKYQPSSYQQKMIQQRLIQKIQA